MSEWIQLWLLDMEWQFPWVFFLLPLPLLALFIPRANREVTALRLPFFRSLESRTSRPGLRWPWLFAIVPIWLCLVAAAAGPTELDESVSLPSKGRDMLLSIDLSGSMSEEDMNVGGRTVSRLTAVQKIAGDFIRGRKGDRIGLVLFADSAYLQAPLTPDRRTVFQLLREAELGMAGQSTAIGDGIGIGVKHLMKRPADHRVLILLTDGENTAGSVDPIDAAEVAAEAKVKIYTIGFGTNRYGYGVDAETLDTIANMTGGRYFHAGDAAELRKIYALLDKLEPIADEAGSYRPRIGRAHELLLLAAIATLLCLLAVVGYRVIALFVQPKVMQPTDKNYTAKTS